LNEEHRTGITLENVFINGIKPTQVHLDYDDITTGGHGVNFPLEGKSVKVVTGAVAGGMADECRGKFVPMR